MEVIDHGEWVSYNPENPIRIETGIIMYCRRVSDQKDWYEYLKEKTFRQDSLKMTVMKMDEEVRISTAVQDASRLFPANQQVIEVIDAPNDAETYWGRLYDHSTKTFVEKRKPE